MDFIITGIWRPDTHITHVMLHTVNGNSVPKPGTKTSREAVINLIKNRKEIFTAEWDYTTSDNWTSGAKVGYETKNNFEYLRSHKDGVTTNNLDNLIDMSNFF